MESNSRTEVGCFNCGQLFLPLGEDAREQICDSCRDLRNESKAVSHARYELWRWQNDRGDNFTQLLYTLISKSDQQNLWRLKLAFPIQYRTYFEWFNNPEPEKLLEEWKSQHQS